MRTRLGRENFPDWFQKASIMCSIFGVIGAAIGACLWFNTGKLINIGIGALVGCLTGDVVSLILNKRLSLGALRRIDSGMNFFLGVLALFLAAAGLIGFLRTGNWVGILGAVLFGGGSIYLLRESMKKGRDY